jgi:hypothetical protein
MYKRHLDLRQQQAASHRWMMPLKQTVLLAGLL